MSLERNKVATYSDKTIFLSFENRFQEQEID